MGRFSGVPGWVWLEAGAALQLEPWLTRGEEGSEHRTSSLHGSGVCGARPAFRAWTHVDVRKCGSRAASAGLGEGQRAEKEVPRARSASLPGRDLGPGEDGCLRRGWWGWGVFTLQWAGCVFSH